MYKQCNSEVTAKRQRQLENCLLELMQVNTYQKIAVGDICKLAGVPRGMFYRYFDSKQDALYALIDHTLLAFITDVIFLRKNDTEDMFGMAAKLSSDPFRYIIRALKIHILHLLCGGVLEIP